MKSSGATQGGGQKEADATKFDPDGEMDAYTVSAKYGHKAVITAMLKTSERLALTKGASTAEGLPTLHADDSRLSRRPLHDPDDGDVSPALIECCKHGHWIPALIRQHYDELNARDAEGLTPLMWALAKGHDKLAQKLLDIDGVRVDMMVNGDEGTDGGRPRRCYWWRSAA